MNPAVVVPPLMDLESGGYVRLVEHGDPTKKFGPAYKVKEMFEVYGPVHVPPRGMRLLYGTGSEKIKQQAGLAGRVMNRKTGKPLAATIHICRGSVARSETPATISEKAKDGAQKQCTKVIANSDGSFRLPIDAATWTVLAEVDGKFYSCAPVAVQDAAAPVTTEFYPSITIEEGKWADILAEVDAPAGS
jgi:hypothetical protein